MADEIDALFMFGDDLEAILDVLEEDERIQDDFTAALNLVSVEDCIFLVEFCKNTLENVKNVSVKSHDFLVFYIYRASLLTINTRLML